MSVIYIVNVQMFRIIRSARCYIYSGVANQSKFFLEMWTDFCLDALVPYTKRIQLATKFNVVRLWDIIYENLVLSELENL